MERVTGIGASASQDGLLRSYAASQSDGSAPVGHSPPSRVVDALCVRRPVLTGSAALFDSRDNSKLKATKNPGGF
jgi:hypothetical protein